MNSELWNDIRNHPMDGTPVLVWDLHREEAVLASWMDHEGEWGIEDAQGRISRVDASFKAAAWMHAPLPPCKSPASGSIPSNPAEVWQSMASASCDGVPIITWHPQSGRVIITLWDLGCYADEEGWCIESADGERWSAGPRHGHPGAWMPAPVFSGRYEPMQIGIAV